MPYEGSDFYDDAGVFASYATLRLRTDSANDTLERPMMRALLGDVRGHDVLDLGCGDALFGRQLLAAGARSYLGIDGSRNMIERAEQNLTGTVGRVVRADLTQWDSPAGSCSRVCSSLALHYLEDLAPVFRRVHQALRADGQMVFSVEHPVLTSGTRTWNESGPRQDWIVDDYFDTGRRVTEWLGARVVKYHRTVEDYFIALQACGFRVETLRESRPVRANFMSEEAFLRRHQIPLFLFVVASKA